MSIFRNVDYLDKYYKALLCQFFEKFSFEFDDFRQKDFQFLFLFSISA